MVFLCTRDKHQIHKNAIKSGNSNKLPNNDLKVESRNSELIPCKTPSTQQSNDIEKGLSNQHSYSPQLEEFGKDSNTSFLRSFPPNTPSPRSSTEAQRTSVVFANPSTASKGTHREVALPPPPHLERIQSLDPGLCRSQSDVRNNKISPASRTYSNSNISPEHPLEICTNKRSMIPLPDTPKYCPPISSKPRQSVPTVLPGHLLKRGKSQSDLDIPCGDMDLGYEALTLDRNFNKKRCPQDMTLDVTLQGSYPRPSYYAKLKKNSLHGSCGNVTPPNSAFISKAPTFEFSPKNTKRRRIKSNSAGPENSPLHFQTHLRQPESSPTSTTKPNQYATELKPILSQIIQEMNKQMDGDPATDTSTSKLYRKSSDTSEIHENSIYNLNGFLSSLSTPEHENGIKERDTITSISSNDEIHENCLYASVDGDLDEIAVKNQALNNLSSSPSSQVVLGTSSSYSDKDGSMCYSELERSDSDKQKGISYYHCLRVEDSDESNATSGRTKSSGESNYGKFLQNPIEGYDTLDFTSNTNKWKSASDNDASSGHSSPPNITNGEAHQYAYLSDGDEDITVPRFNKRIRNSVHDYEKINEDELIINLTPCHVSQETQEIGPF